MNPANVLDETRPGLTLHNRISKERVLAIDAFRGITILIMIFVNNLGGAHGIPAWMEHMPADVDGMTFVDVIFPAFLFIVGMSIPFAISQRLSAGDTTSQLQMHILLRALGLLVLGVFMVNAEEGYNEQAMHMSIFLWNLLFYAAAILVWNAYPFTNKTLERGLRLAGILALLTLACIFRGGKDGSVYLAPQWWGILGLIGWAYLIACIVYQLSNGRIAPIMIALALCSGYYCAAHLEAVNQSFALRIIFSQTDNASHTSIALGGVITSLIFFDRNKSTSTVGRFAEAMLLALAMVVAGYFLRPYFKISKIYATPTWCLYSAAICVVLFTLLYWLIDLKKLQAWTTFFKPAASNPLLTYLIPFIIYSLMQYLNLALPETFNQGVMAIIWSASYAVTVMGMVTILNRLHIRLQL